MKFPFIPALILCLSVSTASFAGSATWNLDPTDDDWNTPANWTPATVPNGVSDVATFGITNQSSVNISARTLVGSIVFAPEANAYKIMIDAGTVLTVGGDGIDNQSGAVQTFSAVPGPFGSTPGVLRFAGTASAGTATIITPGGSNDFAIGANTIFSDTSTADHAVLITTGVSGTGNSSGILIFKDDSTAGFSVITAEGGGDFVTAGAIVSFSENSSAGNATITSEGAGAPGSFGGQVSFTQDSTAGEATLIASGRFGTGGFVEFFQNSSGGAARIQVLDEGYFGIDSHNPPGITVGSIEGNGIIFLGSNNITVGADNLSTTFSGVIDDAGAGGSLTKIGKGTMTLSGANTYTGGTIITQGTLRARNTTGSATGSGSVQVNGGRVGGTGIIAGETTVGPGTTAAAILEPSAGGKRPAVLTIQSALRFTGGTFNYLLDTKRAEGDQVVANGVSIENQDRFSFLATNNNPLSIGQVFVAISNTAQTAISGTFGNLPDGSTFQAGRNKFQADYEGGDGNDLTLTVVP